MSDETNLPNNPGNSNGSPDQPQGWLPPPGPSEPSPGSQPSYGGWLPPAAGPSIPVTPRQSSPATQLDYAGWWSRLGANLLDSMIVAIPIIALGLAVFFGLIEQSLTFSDDLESVEGSLDAGQIVAVVAAGLVAVIYGFGYAPFWMSRTNGQTIGKQATKIRVVREDGKPIGFWFAAAREAGLKGLAVGAASQLTFGLASLLNYLWPLWDSENRAVHDIIIKTRVIKAPSEPKQDPPA